MLLTNYYLHAVENNNGDPFNSEKTLTKLERILNDGYLLSRRKLGDLDRDKGGWQGFDYISLCDYSLKDSEPYGNNQFYKGYTSYNTYIKQSLSLILNKKGISTVKPELMPPVIFDWDSLQEMRYLGNHPSQRFSDFPDELQVKNQVSLKNLEGITIPLTYMTDTDKNCSYTKDMLIAFLKDIQKLLKTCNFTTLIYDLDTSTELNNGEEVENALIKLKI